MSAALTAFANRSIRSEHCYVCATLTHPTVCPTDNTKIRSLTIDDRGHIKNFDLIVVTNDFFWAQ
jgi:hypothetical protein